jgi:hypothetical protein
MINHPNVAIARAEDVLAEARNCIECLRLAAETLDEKRRSMRQSPCWTNTAMATRGGLMTALDRTRVRYRTLKIRALC